MLYVSKDKHGLWELWDSKPSFCDSTDRFIGMGQALHDPDLYSTDTACPWGNIALNPGECEEVVIAAKNSLLNIAGQILAKKSEEYAEKRRAEES